MKRWFAGAVVVMAAGFALPAPAFAQQAKTGAQDTHPAWLIGDWSADECKNLFGLLPDGKVKTSDGGSTWKLEGDTLTFVIDGETIARQITKVNDDTIQIVNGPALKRCHNAPAS